MVVTSTKCHFLGGLSLTLPFYDASLHSSVTHSHCFPSHLSSALSIPLPPSSPYLSIDGVPPHSNILNGIRFLIFLDMLSYTPKSSHYAIVHLLINVPFQWPKPQFSTTWKGHPLIFICNNSCK